MDPTYDVTDAGGRRPDAVLFIMKGTVRCEQYADTGDVLRCTVCGHAVNLPDELTWAEVRRLLLGMAAHRCGRTEERAA
jgi:hypothetical protein